MSHTTEINRLKIASVGKLPLKYQNLEKSEGGYSSELKLARLNAKDILNKDQLDDVTKIEICLDYASKLLVERWGAENMSLNIEQDLYICLLNCSYYYRCIAIDMLDKAYELVSPSNTIWATAGQYLKKGLGLLQFLEEISQAFSLEAKFHDYLIQLISEFKLIQQLAILMLSLSKLKSKLSNPESNALDLQSNQLKEASSTSFFTAKLCIGCFDSTLQLKQSDIISRPLRNFLESLSFLLLSMDQFRNDESGVAIGMLEESINILSQIVPRSQLTATILDKSHDSKSTKDRFLKKNKLLKNTLQHKMTNLKVSSVELLPFLNEALSDFLIPLIGLLRYVYKHTNENLFFKPIENNPVVLKKLFPKGKTPDVDGIRWGLVNSRLQENADANEPRHMGSGIGNYF
ncbi:hypothetical protein KAFR_0C02300 [Kazachstania africana CBS 2517]|uniref:Uncharacterized protein n=1 Tax=Kazachstania africana (strain ATCC 22294 / BCRC 22015 / CBS 2517 / CECT 1963 / NBRC 1671 / NRRL Y-8276) TaxID=1071382 RepID=H2AS73_KAZAF|nr:hypothetical protein KAFR_0C02300 [Kazachstania africana CBS 2517]CCF57223.1 hypothetical protein KAFR_0C02300 [Kazachstania africana CBS 2517]